MARSKTWAIGQSALLENTIANNNEWKENLRLSQQYPSLFGRILFLVVEATNSLLTISSRMFPELSPCVNGQEFEYPCNVNANESKNSKIGESGNIANPEKSLLVFT